MSISSIGSTTSTYDTTALGQRKPPQMSMDNTSELLGLTPQEIQDAEKSGKSLADLAAEKGVSKDDLVSAVSKDLQASKPADAPDLSTDQLTQMATDIVDGKRPHRPGGGNDADADSDGSTSSDDRSAANVTDVATSTGTDIESLLEKLRSGDSSSSDDIVALLTKSNSANYGTSLSDLINGGLSVDTYA